MENFPYISDSSFIICTKDRPDDMIKFIKSLLIQTILPKELVIIDAGKTRELKEIVTKLLKGSKIKFIYKQTRPNTSEQRNIGISLATGNIIFFFDDDVVLDKDYHEKILDVYYADKQKEVAGVMGVIKNEIRGHLLGRIFRKICPLEGREPEIKNYPGFSMNAEVIKAVSHMWGCQMSFRRETLDKHLFDEEMGQISGYAFLEDLEITGRIARKYVLLETSLAKIMHNVSPIARDKAELLEMVRVVNTHHIFKKNVSKTFINYLIFFWQQIGIFLHALAQVIRQRDGGWIIGVLKGYRHLLFLGRNDENRE